MTDLTSDTEKDREQEAPKSRWRSFFGRNSAGYHDTSDDSGEDERRPSKWSMGVLNDKFTHEVPGSVLLLAGDRNEPLGLRNVPVRTSNSSLPTSPTPYSRSMSRRSADNNSRSMSRRSADNKKKTGDGKIILDPQPDDSHNDPLNWAKWRRDTALVSLGLYCMIGGGMTPILAAGFTNVAQDYNVSVPRVALTTGLYMMGLGLGSVFASPTAILYGKRPVYLVSAILLIVTSSWCAASPSYTSLVIARIVQGVSISPVECLPSATIAEIFFLHERAYRLGIYTLLLLGGKNIVPLVSAVIINSLSWRWVFWIVAMIAAFCWVLLFLFVPETFWDRSPRPKIRRHSHEKARSSHEKLHSNILRGRKPSLSLPVLSQPHSGFGARDAGNPEAGLHTTTDLRPADGALPKSPTRRRSSRALHVGFAQEEREKKEDGSAKDDWNKDPPELQPSYPEQDNNEEAHPIKAPPAHLACHDHEDAVRRAGTAPSTPASHNSNSPYSTSALHNSISPHSKLETGMLDFPFRGNTISKDRSADDGLADLESTASGYESTGPVRYTALLQEAPRRTFIQELKPWNGRLRNDRWFHVAIRPFILFAYPAVLWSSVVYACSVGWLIVLSESVATVYRTQSTYNFSALATGLIYISPFIGGILGTAVAGKVSDVIVRAMSRRNGGLYEPEFRLVMAIPIAISTTIGLMGFGWSAEVHDSWIVPTVFFGVISFGCSLGSTTAITFCVDSYRVYAGEALVTLNFSKNIFHGLVFSLFVTSWLESDGSKKVFVAIGGIQMALMLFSIPMYIYGKRARMWTARKNFMEKF